MAYDTLTDFLSELDSRGELLRISSPVSSRFEIAAVTREVTLQNPQAPALLFNQVDGQSIPIVTNLLGTESRMQLALRVEKFEDLADRLMGLLAPELPTGWQNALQLIPRVTQLMKLPPIETQTGRCQQVVRIGKDVNLAQLPIPFAWQNESAPSLTAGVVHAKDPVTGARILSRITLELTGPASFAMHTHPGDDLHTAILAARDKGMQFPLAVSLGGDPVIGFASQLPLPRGTDPAMIAGFLRNKPLELISARTQEIQVPSNVEMTIEGYVDSSEDWQSAGPIAAPTGFYGPVEIAPTMHVTAYTHSSNPALPATIGGPLPNESEWIGRATEQLFLPLVKVYVRDLVNLHWPRCGIFRNWLFVSIRKTHPYHARQVMHALWGLHGLAQAKMIVVVDDEVPVTDEQTVWHVLGTNVNPQTDCVFADLPADAYDHSAPHRFAGQKMGFDATRKLPEEGYPRVWPERVEIPAETQERIRQRWSELGLPAPPRSGETP